MIDQSLPPLPANYDMSYCVFNKESLQIKCLDQIHLESDDDSKACANPL